MPNFRFNSYLTWLIYVKFSYSAFLNHNVTNDNHLMRFRESMQRKLIQEVTYLSQASDFDQKIFLHCLDEYYLQFCLLN